MSKLAVQQFFNSTKASLIVYARLCVTCYRKPDGLAQRPSQLTVGNPFSFGSLLLSGDIYFKHLVSIGECLLPDLINPNLVYL